MNTTNNMKVKPKMETRVLVIVAVMSAISVILSYISFTPPLSPTFVKLDFSDFPALIVAFAFGPLAGVMVELIKNLIGLISSGTAGVGELANFIIGSSMAFSAGLIYKRSKTKKGAYIALGIGSLVMALIASVVNYYILLPLYSNFMPMDAIIAAFATFIPVIKTKLDMILYSAIPFNLIKGIIISVMTMLVYKRISPVMKGRS